MLETPGTGPYSVLPYYKWYARGHLYGGRFNWGHTGGSQDVATSVRARGKSRPWVGPCVERLGKGRGGEPSWYRRTPGPPCN